MTSYTISPIWGAGAQLFDNNGVPLVGGKIYTYYAGTTTPLATYTNPTGSALNSNPILTNASGRLPNEIWFPISSSYKFVLKDSNDVLIATYDNIPTTAQPPIVNNASSISYEPGYTVTAGNFTVGATYLITSIGSTDFVAIGAAANVTGIHFTATGIGSGTGTAQYTRYVQNKLQETFSVKDFNAVGDGITDDTAAIQAGINYVVNQGGGTLYFPEGSYLLNGTAGADGVINGIIVPYQSAYLSNNRISLVGAGKSTTLLANNNNMYIIRFCDSNGSVENISLDGNNKTGVTGLGLVPEDTSQIITVVSQSYNYINNIKIANCTEGIVLRCGPTVSGATSGCYYNSINAVDIIDCIRGIWFAGNTTINSGTSNRNRFENITIIGFVRANTGVQIDAGDTNSFYSVDFEGILHGATPNATPTAIIVKNIDITSGRANEINRFYSSTCEANTLDLVNENSTSEFFGCRFTGTKLTLTARPNVLLGGYDASVVPMITPNMVYQQNPIVPGYNTGVTSLDFPIYDKDGMWAAWDLQTSGTTTNIASFPAAYAACVSAYYQKLSKSVIITCRMIFTVTNTATAVTLKLPFLADFIAHCRFANVGPTTIPIYIIGGSSLGPSTAFMSFTTDQTYLSIPAPTTGWNAGAFNQIHIDIQYRAA